MSFKPNKRDCLLVVDLQPDFKPGGALAVAGGDEIDDGILQIVDRFYTVVATQDWHPHDHASFAEVHPERKPFDVVQLHGHPQVLWPRHCVGGTSRADIPSWLSQRADLILRKGVNREVDSYSAFKENWGPDGIRHSTGLMGWLLERGVRRLVTCGLARDVCVLWTVEDAGMTLPQVVLWDLTRSVRPGDDKEVEHRMRRAGAEIWRNE